MKNYWFMALIIMLLTTALAILIHHLLICGRLFDPEDFMHHEVFLVTILAFTGGLIVYSHSIGGKKISCH